VSSRSSVIRCRLRLQGWDTRPRKLELRDYSPLGEDRAAGQQPFAAIISCADSRVSPTLIFDVDRGNISP
jgi:carbonic anhydrase